MRTQNNKILNTHTPLPLLSDHTFSMCSSELRVICRVYTKSLFPSLLFCKTLTVLCQTSRIEIVFFFRTHHTVLFFIVLSLFLVH